MVNSESRTIVIQYICPITKEVVDSYVIELGWPREGIRTNGTPLFTDRAKEYFSRFAVGELCSSFVAVMKTPEARKCNHTPRAR